MKSIYTVYGFLFGSFKQFSILISLYSLTTSYIKALSCLFEFIFIHFSKVFPFQLYDLNVIFSILTFYLKLLHMYHITWYSKLNRNKGLQVRLFD